MYVTFNNGNEKGEEETTEVPRWHGHVNIRKTQKADVPSMLISSTPKKEKK